MSGMIDFTFLFRSQAAMQQRRLAAQDPIRAQELVLRGLVASAANTVFGRAHGFAGIRTVADFQSRVPLRRYEDFWREFFAPQFPRLNNVSWPGQIPFFAESSGTTAGASKFIPVSWAMVGANQYAAHQTLLFHVENNPDSRLLAGESFLLGGSTDLRPLAPGVKAGDLSGIAAVTMPFPARLRAFPPASLALIPDWDEKLDRLARAALHRDIRSFAGTPSWLLLLFQRLADLHASHPGSLGAIYPDLELIIHGGVGYAPYRDIFARWLEGTRATTREVYAASEGYIASADADPDDGMRMLLDNGLFLEFVPVEELTAANPTRHWIESAEIGVDYALVLSSNAGLFGYVIGDIVRLVSRAPPRLVVTGRLGHALSVFGEHLTGAELDAAITAAARAAGGTVTDYAAAARLPTAANPRGQHVFVVEFSGGDTDPAAFATVLDAALAAGNADYAAHRARDVQLVAPEVRFVAPGSFAAWMRARGRLGGQNKVPRVVAEGEIAAIGG
jgi:hypothetical protein